jgi:hypothetical protein
VVSAPLEVCHTVSDWREGGWGWRRGGGALRSTSHSSTTTPHLAPLPTHSQVPSTPGFANPYGGYQVFCAPDGKTGTLSFCPTNTCAGPCNVTAFDNYACLPSDARFGSSSFSVDCFGQHEPPVRGDEGTARKRRGARNGGALAEVRAVAEGVSTLIAAPLLFTPPPVPSSSSCPPVFTRLPTATSLPRGSRHATAMGWATAAAGGTGTRTAAPRPTCSPWCGARRSWCTWVRGLAQRCVALPPRACRPWRATHDRYARSTAR